MVCMYVCMYKCMYVCRSGQSWEHDDDSYQGQGRLGWPGQETGGAKGGQGIMGALAVCLSLLVGPFL